MTSSQRMLAVRYHRQGDVRVDNVPVPGIGPRDALLRVSAVGICTTDQKIAKHGHFKLAGGAGPRILGHEVIGEVAEVGSGVENLQLGARVVVAPVFGCGHCADCTRGDAQLCSRYDAFGITVDGGMAEYMLLPERAIVRGNILDVPAGIADEDAVLLEPLACCYNALQACEMRPGKSLFIIGAGPMGLMHLSLARAFGAATVIVSDLDSRRLRVAGALGADSLIDASREDVVTRVRDVTGGRGADVVIVTAGSAAPHEEAVRAAARFGYVHLFASLPKADSDISISANAIHYEQIRLTGTSGANITHFRYTMSLMSAGLISTSGLVTGRHPIQDAEVAFHEGRLVEHARVLLVPDGSAGRHEAS